ncbi:MAG TPA: M23 family metallopeptidase [Anaerolineales bacterium]
MKKSPYLPLTILAIFTLLFIAACGTADGTPEVDSADPSPTPDRTAEAVVATVAPAATEPTSSAAEAPTQSAPTEPAPAEPQANLTSVEPCGEDVCLYDGWFLLERPVGPDGRNTIDHTSRFGTFRRGSEAIRGVYFLNSTGTPVLASADGLVVVAGDDSQSPYGRYRGAFGNLVILQHDLPGVSGSVFTLYGHLSEVSVEVDDQVQAGQEIGLVGSSGDISGSSLYFEVRYGENAYQSARNPELWLKPVSEGGAGGLAGRIVNAEGNFVTVQSIVIEQLAGPGQPALDQFYIRTYAGDSLYGLEPWAENFAMGGLPPGEYQISFLMDGMRQQVVEVTSDDVTVVTFQIE